MYVCMYISAKIKLSCIWKDDFFLSKIGIICKSIANPLSEAKTHWMVNWLQLLNQLNNWPWHPRHQGHYAKCSIVENGDDLMCWWRFTHTFWYSCNIHGFTLCFWPFHTLVYRCGCQYLSLFFHKIMNKRSWRCFSSSKIRMQFSHTFCNITVIFKVMSQYFPALFKRIRLTAPHKIIVQRYQTKRHQLCAW